ncbi:MAG: tetratricopeptide repeat protein [Chloroflexi bacterium]|nr:tetratricopeptide repeat protein [Chloroflexota bacterium]
MLDFSDMNRKSVLEMGMLQGMLGIYGIECLIMRHGRYCLVTSMSPLWNSKPPALKEHLLKTANRLMDEGLKYREAGEYENAEFCFHQITVWFNYLPAFIAMAWTVKLAGRQDEAVVWLREALKIEPDNAYTNFELGNFLDENPESYAEAERFYKKAISIDKNSVNALNNLGLLLKTQGRYKEALVYAHQCLKLSPEHRSYKNLSIILYALYLEDSNPSIMKELIETFQILLKLDPNDAIALFQVGYFYMVQREFSKSEHFFRRALEVDPSDADTYKNLVAVLKMQGRDREAEEFRKKAISLGLLWVRGSDGVLKKADS